jgi:hypothetical protein
MRSHAFLLAAALLIAGSASRAQADDPAQVHLALVPASAATAASGSGPDQALFAEALRLHRSGRWSAAYGRFLQLADAGHVDAARIALQMLRHGGELYGTEWTAAASQVAAWERTVGEPRPYQVVQHGE